MSTIPRHCTRTRTALASAALSVALLAVAACTSVSSLREAKVQATPAKALATQTSMLKEFTDKKSPSSAEIRGQYLDTMTTLAVNYKFRETNQNLYAQTVTAIKQEISAPNIKQPAKNDGKAADRVAYVRSYAVWCLGRLDDPDLTDTLIGYLDGANTIGASCRAAALDALVPYDQKIKPEKRHRQQLYKWIGVHPSAAVATNTPADSDLKRLTAYFEESFKDLDTVTELLGSYLGAQGENTERIATLIKWNFQILDGLAKDAKATVTRDSLAANAGVLSDYAASDQPALAHGAKAILTAFAPYHLLHALVGKSRKAPNRDLFEQVVIAYGKVDAMSAAFQAKDDAPWLRDGGRTVINECSFVAANPFAEIKPAVFKGVQGWLLRSDEAENQFLLNRILAHEPVATAAFLAANGEQFLGKTGRNRLDTFILLGSMLDQPAVSADSTLRRACISAIAQLTRVDAPDCLDLSAAYLLARFPAELCNAAAERFIEFPKRSAAGAGRLLDIYCSGLIAIEAASPEHHLDPARYQPLKHVFLRLDEASLPFIEGAIGFIEPRDPPVLSSFIVAGIHAKAAGYPGKNAMLIARLCSLVLRNRAAFADDVLQATLGDLLTLYPTMDEEAMLMTTRYLLDIKHAPTVAKLTEMIKDKSIAFPSVVQLFKLGQP